MDLLSGIAKPVCTVSMAHTDQAVARRGPVPSTHRTQEAAMQRKRRWTGWLVFVMLVGTAGMVTAWPPAWQGTDDEETHSATNFTVYYTDDCASYPATGSTGDGYRLAESIGHAVVPVRPALVPLETEGHVNVRLNGLSLRNVRVKGYVDGKKRFEAFGEMSFTEFGVSGPIILALSGRVVEALNSGRKVYFSIDLKPALDERKLDARLLRELNNHGRKIQVRLQDTVCTRERAVQANV